MSKAKGIFKRVDSKFWWIDYMGPDGVRRRESTMTTSKTEALYILSCRRKTVMEGKVPEVKRIKNTTLKAFSEPYLIWAERQRSIESKRWLIKGLIGEFGNITLNNFNTQLIEQYQSKRLKEGKKPATVNRALATLKHMLTKAVEWEMADEDVLKKVRRAKLLPENNRRLRYLKDAEENKSLIEACSPHLKPIVITALNTGMRKGEILGLTWERVDRINSLILLDITKNGERREIPINSTLRTAFEERVLTNINGSPYVFCDNSGKPFDDVKRSFASACTKAGIKDFHFHDLRHTFASQLVMKGVDITTVKELLGHKTLTMTLRYAHLAPSHKLKAVEMLDGVEV
jgi:integrase